MAGKDTGDIHGGWQEAARIMPTHEASRSEVSESLASYKERVADRWQRKKVLGTYPRLRASVVYADKSVVILQGTDGVKTYSRGFVLADVILPEVMDEDKNTRCSI